MSKDNAPNVTSEKIERLENALWGAGFGVQDWNIRIGTPGEEIELEMKLTER